ncbi:DUF2235 domain-containing protein [Sulfuritalea sp.]|uniref:phospholipase effector Tle1 domain-containing protein n=1 Tax=Sulfuritalea sp. TaxID=2480090 RepID=UPI001AD52C39|nr:DUF2235 domain-containing protein [Sulfuritalea sp.]MBN8474839.1 DUF2235 domain-containing protein [Sulfuritalea sp.]
MQTIELNPSQLQDIYDTNMQRAQAIASNAQQVSNDQFIFFAAFDGTTNDKNNAPTGEQSTNVWQLFNQVIPSDSLKRGYYPGPGTSAALRHSSWLPSAVTQQVINAAEQAYKEFAEFASEWVKANPNKPVSIALTSFSRGAASAAIFSQLVYERGVIDPNDGTVLVPPGQVQIAGGVIFDPVTTGVNGNLAFAPNVQNVVVVKALNEYRNLFSSSDFSQAGVSTIGMYGNHGDIGGGYQADSNVPEGIGAITLEAATRYFQNTGLNIGNVPAERAFVPPTDEQTLLATIRIHTEAYDNYANQQWSVTNTNGFAFEHAVEGQRLRDTSFICNPASPGNPFTLYNGDKVTVTDTGNGTETVARLKTNADGSTLKETLRYAWIGDANHPDKIVDRVTVEIGSDGTTANIKVVAYVGNHQIGISVPDGVTSAAIDVQAADGIDPATISTSIHSVDGTPTSIAKTGVGSDIYYAEVNDTIRDADGKGTVYLNGKQLSFATRKKGETTWTDSAGNTYALTNGRLEINDPLVIEGFDNGELGIYLDEEEDPDDPVKPPPYNPNSSTRFFSSPLALDLNDNGVIDDVSLANSTVYFDLTDDGIAEKTGWLAPGDGLLGMDVNGNGVIDDRGELFGTTPDLTAFDRMREVVDTNGDGFINANDPLFGALRVWQDANQDGISQAGELKTLDELGITSIDANATRIQEATANGNNLVATAGFTRNGELKTIVDIEFASNTALTNANPNRPLDLPPSLDSAVFQLPWLRGFGLVKSLPLAYQESPALRQAVTSRSRTSMPFVGLTGCHDKRIAGTEDWRRPRTERCSRRRRHGEMKVGAGVMANDGMWRGAA